VNECVTDDEDDYLVSESVIFFQDNNQPLLRYFLPDPIPQVALVYSDAPEIASLGELARTACHATSS